jgi:hypothetical protein
MRVGCVVAAAAVAVAALMSPAVAIGPLAVPPPMAPRHSVRTALEGAPEQRNVGRLGASGHRLPEGTSPQQLLVDYMKGIAQPECLDMTAVVGIVTQVDRGLPAALAALRVSSICC